MNDKKYHIIGIKVLYALCVFSFGFIIWSIIANAFFKGSMLLLLVGILGILALIIVKCFKLKSVDYILFKDEVRNMILVLAVSIIFVCLADYKLKQELFKFYLIFVIFAVLLLRETRDFLSNIRNKRSMRNSIFITIFMLFLSLDIVFKEVIKVVSILLGFLNYLLDFIATCIISVVAAILGALFSHLKFSQSSVKKIIEQGDGKVSSKTNAIKNPGNGFIYLDAVLKVIVFIIIALVIYFVIKYFLRGNDKKILKNSEDEVIQVENIGDNRNNKSMMKFFRKRLSNNDKIRLTYLKFERLTSELGIFKFYYTATELTDIVKKKLHSEEEANNISKIYNKTKFSNVNSDQNDVKAIEVAYKNIKKNLR
jgi:membrane protein implicated in regulation of membrane protease activity